MTTLSARPATGFLYVTRLPPSPSGVALYAQDFLEVLRSLGPTRVVIMPARPERSQRLTEFFRLWGRLRRAIRERPDDIVFLELAGRGLAEFWAAVLLGRSGSTRVWFTIHDAPEISGGAFFFGLLDRKGFRRIADALSRTVGRRAERFLLRHGEKAFTLSETGAQEIRGRFGDVRPRTVAHVVSHPALPLEKKPYIFLPGYASGMANIAPVLDALDTAPPAWELGIGALDERTARELRSTVVRRGLDSRVRLLGFQSEQELLETFAQASIVVRWRAEGWAKPTMPQHGAVSGPLMRAIANRCAIVTNDNRGSVACLRDAAAIRVGDGKAGAHELRSALSRLITDDRLLGESAEASRRHYEREHTPLAVAHQLESS
jgi:hypothetical protein